MRSTPEECIAYCKKEKTRVDGPWELGEYLKKGSNKCKRAVDEFKEDPDEMRLRDPKVYRRCMAGIINEEFRANFKFEYPLHNWQSELVNMLELEPQKRNIIWVYGPDGGEGKTTFAKKLITEGWLYTRGGNSDNVA